MALNGFDLEYINSEFTAALLDDGQIDLDHYLKGHAEVTRLLKLLGTIFGFVHSDVKGKCTLMTTKMEERPQDLATVNSMIDYELEAGLTGKKDAHGRDSASRTFLRLHRALEFFCVLLKRLEVAADHDATSTMTSATYAETLGKYHPWVVRQMAYLAIRSLPNKKQLITRYCKQNSEEAQRWFPVALATMQKVYDAAQELLEENDLLNLP